MSSTDIISILSAFSGLVGSGLLSVFGDSIDAIAPGWGKKTVGVITAACYACALIVYVLKNRTPTNTIVVHDQTTGLAVPIQTVAKPGDPPVVKGP